MTNTMTPAGKKLYAKLPSVFVVFEDFSKSMCPPTIIQNENGREVYSFTTGDAKAFKKLSRDGFLEYGGSLGEPGGAGKPLRVLYAKTEAK